jgi:hypothetical protein
MLDDPFRAQTDTAMAPAARCFSIEPSDSAELAQATKAIYIGQPGDVTLRSVQGFADVTFRNLQPGTTLDVRVRAVRATGTTAGDIVGLA